MSIVYLSLSFLARGKQSAVAVVPIGPHCLEGQPGCYLSFRFYIPSNTSLPSEQKRTVCVCTTINCHTGTPKEPPGALLLILKRQRCLHWKQSNQQSNPFLGRFCTRISGKPRSCRAWSACLHPRQGRGARPRARRPGGDKNLELYEI